MPPNPASPLAAVLAAAVLASCGTSDDVSEPQLPVSPTATGGEPAPSMTDTHLTTEGPTAVATGTVIAVRVSDGQVTGAEERVTVPIGSDVTITVTTDVDDQVHVHGYDLHHDVTAGQEATLTFAAEVPGVFEVELENTGTLLTRLEVR